MIFYNGMAQHGLTETYQKQEYKQKELMVYQMITQ